MFSPVKSLFLSRLKSSCPQFTAAVLAVVAAASAAQPATAPQATPNFVIILADDLGYGDLGCYGGKRIRTPNLDRLAAEGMRFTSFYAQPVCGPSRAALMTGSYPLRVAKRKNQVEHHPRLHSQEITIAEILKTRGYVTAAFGKWDLAGHSQTNFEPDLLPPHQGFDEFFGTPSSNDSTVNLVRGTTLVERGAAMANLTERYTDEAIAFIRRSKDRPFFVYLAHTMPHTRLAATPAFAGKSSAGLYGDVVEELDAQVGRLWAALRAEGLDESTYFIFTSDNGPWFLDRHLVAPDDNRTRDAAGQLKYPFNQRDERGAHFGSSGPLRGAKASSWEGGFRVPFIVRAPGRVPAGVTSHEPATTLDLLPTVAKLAGARVPTDRIIDGHDITPLIHGQTGTTSPTEAFYYYAHTRLTAVRAGRWKLHLPRPEDERWAVFVAPAESAAIAEPLLFDLEADIGERNNVAAQHPQITARLLAFAEKARADIGDFDRVGAGARFFDPEPRRPDIPSAKRSND
ncbi:MAG: sulfatase [Opitutaceae bacterium]|nr:sulfatase [Opitutaceae bacterium]